MLAMIQVYSCIRDNLKRQPEHVARIISGHACEAWFSSEAFAALNWPMYHLLPQDHCASTEFKKRDLTIFNEKTRRAIATVESKVISNDKNFPKRLDELKEQVDRPDIEDERPYCQRCGIVYVIWADYWLERASPPRSSNIARTRQR